MNIVFELKTPLKTRSAVNAVLWFRGSRYRLATGLTVEVAKWDFQKKFIAATKDADADFYRTILTRFEGAVKTVFSAYMLSGEIPAAEQVRNEVKAITAPARANSTPQTKTSQKAPKIEFMEFFETYFNNAPYKESTFKKYQTCFNWLQRFERDFKTRLTFATVDISFYDHFKNYVINATYVPKRGEDPRNYSLNYLGSLVKCIKKVLRESGPESRAKLHTNTDYRVRDFKTDNEPGDAIYLTVRELEAMHAFDPTPENIRPICTDTRAQNIDRKIEALRLAKNKFLIGCFTALRVSDFNRLQAININDNYIRIQPVKGTRKNEDVVIPIHPIVREILKAGFNPAAVISDQKLNEHIKEVARLVGIVSPVPTTRTEGGRLVERIYKKYELVTTHTARRSGATNMYLAGIPSISIMKITGHRTEASFLKYIKISQEENARLLADHPFFK